MASAAPMPRAAPVTTAVRPSSLKGPPLSVRSHYRPHPRGCRLCYISVNCIRNERMCPEQIYTPLDALSTGSVAGSYAFRGRAACLQDHTPGCWSKPSQPRVGWALSLRSDVDTAVYVDRLACDVVTVFYKVADGPCDLFWFSEAAEGHLFAEFLLCFLGNVGDHIRLYESGAESVDGDPEACQFLGCRLGESE